MRTIIFNEFEEGKNWILSECSYVQLRYFRKMAHGYCPVPSGCTDVLGIKPKVSGTVV